MSGLPRAVMPLRSALFAAGLVLAPAVAANDAAADWLLRLSSAARSSNYQGVLVYKGDETLETFHVTHRYQDGLERERVQSVTGEVREVLRQNDMLTCILPREQRLTMNQPTPKGLFPSLSVHRIAMIEERYEIKELPGQRIAGRQCRGVRVAPRDEMRYGYEVFADAETAVPLKVSLVRADGRVVEQVFFTAIEFPKRIADSAFETDLAPEAVARASAQAADAIVQTHKDQPADEPDPAVGEAPQQSAMFNKLPPGFRVIRRDVRMLPNGRGQVEHVVLSDGLSAVSVYRAMREAGAVEAPPGASQRIDQIGAVSAYSRMVGKIRITVVGEAPRQTVKMIGDNFEAVALPAADAASGAAPAN